MSAKANPTVIGAFTLAGLLIAAAATVLFGAGNFFRETHLVQLYFDKSAYGLQVGSGVRFGGVRIGSVKAIDVLADFGENRKIIPVTVELGQRETAGTGIDFTSARAVADAVKRGLRAGMKQESLVTGQLYIEFDIAPGTAGFVYHSDPPSPHPVVPTIGTEMDELIAGIADGIRKFNELDVESVIGELRDLLKRTSDQIGALNMEQINTNILAATEDIRAITGNDAISDAIASFNNASAEIEKLAARAGENLDPLVTDLREILEQAGESIARLDESVREIANISNPRGPVLLRMQDVLNETERASRALHELSNDLQRTPNAIISGRAKNE